MRHARLDYERIQDPAANPELLLAYNEAMTMVAHGPPAGRLAASNETRDAYKMLSRLTRALSPQLSPFVTADGIRATPGEPIANDEPVFILRARDQYAPDVVEYWVSRVYDRGRKRGTGANAGRGSHARRRNALLAKTPRIQGPGHAAGSTPAGRDDRTGAHGRAIGRLPVPIEPAEH